VTDIFRCKSQIRTRIVKCISALTRLADRNRRAENYSFTDIHNTTVGISNATMHYLPRLQSTDWSFDM